jgi:hypothetical protein
MCADRFRYYLHGGQPPGASRAYPGARDRSLPRADNAVWLPGGVYFATKSLVWGGGRAFYDPDLPGKTAGRAYLITVEQFSDVAAQEMYREPGINLDLARAAGVGRIQLGPRAVRDPGICWTGRPGPVTFTAPWGINDVPLVSPSAAYLRMLGQGLREAHSWDPSKVADYLVSLPGARGSWRAEEIVSLLG